MRTQVTKSELLKLSAILIVYLLGVVQVGIVRTVSAQDPTNLPPDVQPLLHTQQAQLTANDGASGDFFGNAVAISNNTAVVGASRQPSGNRRGAAYVFVRSGASWSQQQQLIPADGVNGDDFAISVAIDADTVVVGAPSKTIGGASGRGAAYVFVRSGTTWTQQQQLIASDGALFENFGTSVAVSGETIVVGSPNHAVGANTRQGAAYVFVRSGSTWTFQQKLTASDGLISDQLGGSVALVGNTAVVGARENNFGANRNGKVYVFLRTGTTWSQQQKLTASDGSSLDAFGNSVAISHNADTIAVGAFDDDEPPVGDRGSVYVFVRDGTTWSQQQRLLGSLGLSSGSGGHFGSTVAVNGDTLIAGAPELDPNQGGNGRGAVYLFDRSGSTWTEHTRFLIPGSALREFGTSVAMSGDSFIGGAIRDPVGTNVNQGSAYVFATGHTLSIGDVSVAEGNSGTTQATFTVTLSAASTHPVVVNYATTDGTAIAGSDYVAASGTLTFNPGETSKTFNVTINGDTLFEANETFFVDLSNPVNANITQGRATGTITNDDPPPSISINDVSQAEGNSGTTNFTFTVTLSAISGLPATVNYATADGTATAGSDYQSTSGALTFDPGQTSKQIMVAVNGDTQNEADETFLVNLSSPSNSTIAKAQGVGTILNDDADVPIVQFSASNYNVQEDCTTVTVTVNRIGAASAAANVDYFTSDVTASDRRDYIAAIGTLRFAAGETSKSFPLLINEDSYVEGPETFNVTLTNPSGVNLGAPSVATVTIDDDATEPATNVIDDARNFACQCYHDFLNRQPDQSGWDFWTNEIASCGNDPQCIEVKRINVSAAFYLSIEFQETGYLVERLYKSAYGDAMGTSTFNGTHQLPVPIVRFNEFLADTQEIGQGVVVGAPGWEQQLENNKQTFVTRFVQRSRFTTALPTTMTPAQFVDQLNTNAGNVLSATERASAIAFFGGATDTSNMTVRAQALRQVAEDQDLHSAEFNRAFVLMQYFGYLRRNPNDQPDTDHSGFDFWLTKLNQFNGNFVNAEMVKAFIVSGEYRQRFGQ
ncbi:MAG: hypothetical protein M3410_03485 [Acidobacteriota bacterium]|nr:hypothetical protein [Acidobacteriota bacterium]